MLLPLKRVGWQTFFLPVFFALYKLVQACTRHLKQSVIRLMNHHERNGRIKKMYLIESWLEYRLLPIRLQKHEY